MTSGTKSIQNWRMPYEKLFEKDAILDYFKHIRTWVLRKMSKGQITIANMKTYTFDIMIDGAVKYEVYYEKDFRSIEIRTMDPNYKHTLEYKIYKNKHVFGLNPYNDEHATDASSLSEILLMIALFIELDGICTTIPERVGNLLRTLISSNPNWEYIIQKLDYVIKKFRAYVIDKVPEPKNEGEDLERYKKYNAFFIMNFIERRPSANNTGQDDSHSHNAYERAIDPPTRGGGRLELLNVMELKDRCRKRKIKCSGLRKAELIAALRK